MKPWNINIRAFSFLSTIKVMYEKMDIIFCNIFVEEDMNYKFETIMTWIMYVRNGIWEIDNHGKYKPDASTIRDKFEALFLNELIREYNDCKCTMVGLHFQIGGVTVFIKEEMIKDCEQYDKRINKKKALKKAGPEEE